MTIAHAAMATLAVSTIVATAIGTTALIVIAAIGLVGWAGLVYQRHLS